MESLLQQHTYARTPLRSFTDSDMEDQLKAAYAHLKRKNYFPTTNILKLTE